MPTVSASRGATAQKRLTPRRQCLPRRGQPDDVAATIAFLAGPSASFITGRAQHSDGGWLLH
ncbi:SDR family oxidoreductase [Streptomyces californicus]|uniref:SDR family oxidoreductase n=1 Tax=Streptomyces californicus TaxID=67351 RepID=UPI00296EE34C|nr:SDR family oxidoreductase [Streptomyces californicus]MDW4916273.1 SDR family oxidoreductase [Streptomyces californicus]